MRIEDLRVSRHVAQKVSKKHNVAVSEVFEVFWNEHDKVMVRKSPSGSGRYVAFGRTEAGRYLAIAFLLEGPGAHVLTARGMSAKERKLYKER